MHKQEALVRETEAARARIKDAEVAQQAAVTRVTAAQLQMDSLQQQVAAAQEQQGVVLRALATQREEQVGTLNFRVYYWSLCTSYTRYRNTTVIGSSVFGFPLPSMYLESKCNLIVAQRDCRT